MAYFDDIAQYNQDRWEELAARGSAMHQAHVGLGRRGFACAGGPPRGRRNVAGKDVLCLAGAGGQQSAAFGILGATVTVLDLTETQLKRDHETAAHYGLEVRTVQGDMRDLSAFDDGAFDLVHHAYSINFVPDPMPVFREVVRVLRPGGLYMLRCANPFAQDLYSRWNGDGYVLKDRYEDGELNEAPWEFQGFDGNREKVVGARTFRHTLSTLLNGLAEMRLVLLGLWEGAALWDDASAKAPEPGSWEHFVSVAPPYQTIWTRLDS